MMRSPNRLNELFDIAKKNGGLLISTKWVGINAKYKFALADGREFERSAKNMLVPQDEGRAGSLYGWPRNPDIFFKFHVRKKRDLDPYVEISALAAANGAKLIESKWHGQNHNYRFEIGGRRFSINGTTLLSNGWTKSSIEDLIIRHASRDRTYRFIELDCYEVAIKRLLDVIDVSQADAYRISKSIYSNGFRITHELIQQFPSCFYNLDLNRRIAEAVQSAFEQREQINLDEHLNSVRSSTPSGG